VFFDILINISRMFLLTLVNAYAYPYFFSVFFYHIKQI